MAKKLIGQYLVEMKAITPAQLQEALDRQAQSTQVGGLPFIGSILIFEMRLIKEDDLRRALDQQDADDWHQHLNLETERSV